MGWRVVVPVPYWASGYTLDQTPPDSQMLKLDETMDSIGEDDPFTAKLSFEVRQCLVLRGLVGATRAFSRHTGIHPQTRQ